MSLSAQIFGRDSGIFKFNNIMLGGGPGIIDSLYRKLFPEAKTPSPTIPTVQDSAYGNPIPRFEGIIGTAGNVIWLKGGKLDVKTKKKSGGKGGQSTAQTTYSYYATFALALGEGPISGIRRIWCADKLIYNAGSDDLETIIASNNAAKGWKLYRGTDDQLPDPDIQADKGVANTPAYRGLAYIKFKKFALKNYGDSLAGSQFKVEVVSGSQIVAPYRIIDKTITNYPTNFFSGPLLSSDSSGAVMSAYQYDPVAGVPVDSQGFPRPNSQRVAGITFDGRIVRYDAVGEDQVMSSVLSSGVQSNLIGVLGDDNVYVAEYYPTWPIGGARELLPMGVLTAPNTASQTGNLGDLADHLPGETGRYIRGCALSSAGDFIFVFTGPVPGTTNALPDRFFQIDSGLNVVNSGSVVNPVRFSAGSVDSFSVASTSVNQEGTLIANADSTSSVQFSLFTVAPGVMTRAFLDTAGFGAVRDRAYVNIQNDVIYLTMYAAPDQRWIAYRAFSQSIVPPTLGAVVQRQCLQSELLSAGDIDVSALTQIVTGYKIVGGSSRDVIEPLRAARPFDVRMHGYKLQFVPRGQTSSGVIPWGDLAATDGDEIGDSLPYDREMDTQLPAKVEVKGISADREYADSTQSYERIGTIAVNTETVDLGLVLSDDELAQIAEKICELRWMERQSFSFSLPPTYQDIEPGDIRTINAKFGSFEMRFTEVSTGANGIVECKGVLNHAALYTSNAVGAPVPVPDGTVSLAGPAFMALVDGPMIYEDVQNSPGFSTAAAGYTPGWPGCVLVRSNDNGQTWVDIQGYDAPGTLGTARNALAANSGALFDVGSSLQVDLLAGELESITEEQMLNGANTALYGADQRWEVIRFQNATLQADGSYVLTKLVRGDRGTEWATGLHQAGDLFIMADDPDNAFIGSPVESIGLQRLYRAVTSGASIDDALDQSLTYRGVNLKPLSPAYPFGSRNSSGDLSASWTRRSRLSSSWWVTGVASPVGEASESYEIDVMSGSTVKRTVLSSTPAITYTAADQTTDFGSPQSAITLRIYQISATVGRGYPLEVTL